MKILIVEDTADLLVIIKEKILSGINTIEIHTAENGKAGLTQVENNQFGYDAILTDFRMPILDGVEFAKEARHYQKCAIYCMTSSIYDLPEDHQEIFTGVIDKCNLSFVNQFIEYIKPLV